MSKNITDARSDEQGNITQVKIDGNKNFTSLEKAIEMTESGKVNAVVVNNKDGSKHLRSPRNSSQNDNLDTMANKNKNK